MSMLRKLIRHVVGLEEPAAVFNIKVIVAVTHALHLDLQQVKCFNPYFLVNYVHYPTGPSFVK